jgi:6,7-dimethyl-8-ribityllumazine synthase
MKTFDAKGSQAAFSVGLVVSRFNEEITQRLLTGALARLKERGFPEEDIHVAHVPGAIEIPLTAQRMAQWGTLEAIICLGAVIRGETDHYDYVCQQVSQGCQHVSLQNDLPVLFGVLTTNDESQAKERSGGKQGNKGADCVDAAIEMVALLEQLG